MTDDYRGLDPATIAVHVARPHEPGAPSSQPVVFTSTYNPGTGLNYAREENPTWWAFEEAMGALEGGSALAFSSGMAAIDSIVGSLPLGSVVVAADNAYYGTRRYLRELAEEGRIDVRFTDVADTEATVAELDGAALVWLESPTNPMMSIADIPTISSQARSQEAVTVVDNTLATPILQNPLELGADIVAHSVSKYISGHSDLVMGVTITKDPGWRDRMHDRRTRTGGIPGPMETFLALRGLRTLALRVERAQSNASTLAQRLADHPRVELVLYPGLESHPGFELARKQMRGPGAMLSFLVAGGADAAESVCGRVRLVRHLTSLGGVETTLERRARYAGEAGTPENLLRISVGIENVEDLWRDLAQALEE